MGGVETAHYMINIPLQGDIVPRSPQTRLRLYSGVPWDNSYQHVRLYNNQNDLLSHLEQWKVIPSTQLNNLAPIRVGDYEIRVPFTEMSALNINYVAFLNAGLTNEWVFCFVTDVKWRSENTTILSLELDVFQNNIYNVNVKPCFVEYHHIPKSEDVIGGNLFPVNIETGEPIVHDYTFYGLTDWHICAYATEGTTGADFEGKICNNVYRAASLWHVAISEKDAEEQANALISTYNDAGKIDAIIALFMAPELCVNVVADPGRSEDEKIIPMPTNFDGYVPKNNKLFSYPWCYLMVDNNEGGSSIYRFELSQGSRHQLEFVIQGALATLPQVICFPRFYKNNSLNYDEALIINGFPQCGYSSDTFRAWVAQNKSTIALTAFNSASDVAIGGFKQIAGIAGTATAPMGGLAGAMMVGQGASQMSQGIDTAKSLIAEIMDKKRLPATSRGKALSENINAAINLTSYSFYTMTCNREFAEVADSFFTTYGYPINRVVMPNLHSRSNWNYVKTMDCGFTGKVDLAQLKELRKIFDTGVTLWHTDDVGNYGLDNN